jgi:hypothetical protein
MITQVAKKKIRFYGTGKSSLCSQNAAIGTNSGPLQFRPSIHTLIL